METTEDTKPLPHQVTVRTEELASRATKVLADLEVQNWIDRLEAILPGAIDSWNTLGKAVIDFGEDQGNSQALYDIREIAWDLAKKTEYEKNRHHGTERRWRFRCWNKLWDVWREAEAILEYTTYLDYRPANPVWSYIPLYATYRELGSLDRKFIFAYEEYGKQRHRSEKRP